MKNTNITQKTVVEQLISEMRKMFVNGTYKQNDKIPTEHELAEKFGVSRSSVREAIKTLRYLGILESHTSKGTRITPKNRIAEEATAWSVMLGYEKIREVFVLGTALDNQVAIIVINNLKNSIKTYLGFTKEMNLIVNNMLKFANVKNIEGFQSEFTKYFRTLYKACKNTVFISLNECIDSLIVAQVCKAYYHTGNLTTAANHLKQIWDSINLCSLVDCITAIQDYGTFAYNTFALYDIEQNT